MFKEEYSPYKIIHHMDKIEQFKEGKQPYPLQVQIVPTNRCCQGCVFCAYRLKGSPSNEHFNDKDDLSYEKIVETLDCMVDMNIKACHITGGGEPLVHPKAFDILKEVLNRKIELALVSNGQLLTNDMCELLGDASWVRVSVDSSSAKNYSFIRNVSLRTFNIVMANIETLVKYRRTSTIGIGFVVEKENYTEILEAAKIFKDLGVDNFRVSAAFTPMGYEYFSTFEKHASELAKKAAELSDSNFTVFNLFSDRVKDLFEGTQDYPFCPIKDLLSYVGADYNVYTCCTLAYNSKGHIGSIKDMSFKDLWDGIGKRDMFDKHNPSIMCQFPCMYKGKNEFINYCIKKDPKHINFI